MRPEEGRGDSTGGKGRDNFGEMFPAFFLEALNPTSILPDPKNPGQLLPAISIEKDGSDGGDAVLLVTAVGDDFLAITQNVNQFALDDSRLSPKFNFETRYILHPDAQYVEIDSKVTNVSNTTIDYPQEIAGAQVPTPFGDVILFGAGNKVFTPNQAGYDLRFQLEDIYASNAVALPAFPGLVQEFVASSSKDVSYGLMTFPPKKEECVDPDPANCAQNFAFANKAAFDACPLCGTPATEHSVHVPFIASAFTGAFQVLPPPKMKPGDSFHVRRAFIVGRGDVAGVSDVVYNLLGDKTGTLTGRVQERQRPRFVEGASVFVEDAAGNKVTEAATHTEGFFDAKLRPGHYQLVVAVPGQAPSAPVGVDIGAGKESFETLFVDSPAELVVTAVEQGVGRVPAKATLVGTYNQVEDDSAPNKFLFDLSVGDPWRYTDLIPDKADDPSTRRFIETFNFSADGVIHLKARPGKYTLVVGRGIEYDRVEIPVTLTAGVTVNQQAVLHRVVDTTGYVSADFHLHSQYSLDSGAKVEDRIASYAAEGLEYAVSTDHNFVVDYQPVIAKLGMEKWINSAVGIELTTIDRGHFQGYPLARQPGSLIKKKNGTFDTIASRTYGSFEWALRTPQQVFDDLRKLGRQRDGKTLPIIVQVNHPRDSILGYFDQYGVTQCAPGAVGCVQLEPQGITNALLKPDDTLGNGGNQRPGRHVEFNKANFSFDFDALEVLNGKRYEFLHSFRVPTDAPTVTLPDGSVHTVNPASCCEVRPGDIVLEPSTKACRDGSKDCTCDADTFQFQLESNNCNTGSIAFPGVVEDWMNLLEARPERPVIGTANSDSHEPQKEEPATPRTYVGVGTDEPQQVTPDDIYDAFQRGDVLMTNGPFVRVTADGVPMGGTVVPQAGKVTLAVHIDSAPWIVPQHMIVYEDGEAVAQEDLAGKAGPQDVTLDVDAAVDGFIIVEITGNGSEFPSIYPNEIPPLQFTDVIGALGSSFGFGSSADALKPSLKTVTTPYALTNPIWVDADGDGKITTSRSLPDPAQPSVHRDRPQIPSLMKHVDVAWVETAAEASYDAWMKVPVRKRIALSRLPMWLWPSDDPRDVRRVLLQFVAHAD